VQLTLDIAPAYPPEAGVRRWTRTLRLERALPSGGEDVPARRGHITLDDDFELAAAPPRLTLHLMSSGPVDTAAPGVLKCATPTRPLVVRYDPAALQPTVEEIAIADARLRPVWGERAFRIVLAATEPAAQGRWRLTIEAGEESSNA
jgi:hypothetical protein